VQWLASFGRGKDDELLITNYLTNYTESRPTFWSSRGQVWFLPIKKAVIDEGGHLRMGYWGQNDALKGARVPPGNAELLYPHTGHETCDGHLAAEGSQVTLDTGCQLAPRDPRESRRTDEHAIAILDERMDLGKGIAMEGSLEIEAYTKRGPTRAGFCFEETSGSGTYLLLEAGHPKWRKTEIGVVRWGSGLAMDVRDVTGSGCATVAGIDDRTSHTFRILYRKNIFEVYVDDLLVQTFITSQPPTGRIGFIVQNARCSYRDVRVWQMVL
jgi:hypothetical protein